jgi:hypothetical protein
LLPYLSTASPTLSFSVLHFPSLWEGKNNFALTLVKVSASLLGITDSVGARSDADSGSKAYHTGYFPIPI